MLPQLLHGGVWIFGRILFWRGVSFPFDKSAADGVILQFVEYGVSGQEHGPHGVRVRKVSFRSVIDYVFQGNGKRLVAELYRKRLIRILSQAVEEGGIDGRWFLPNQPCERSAFCAMPLACGTQAAIQMNLEGGRLGELCCWEFRTALVKIVS